MSQTDKLIAKSISDNPHLAHEHKMARKKLRAAMLVVNLREEKGWSQRELANKLNKPQFTIARIENGDVNPSFGLMDEIAHLADKELTLTKL
ncbi:helix-turn-helix domain-containing protein [Mammaliicoccus sciuri]|uniref:helix-turn-helix domain-containing protein n=1 Tax=Mammaliicoccus sciuri TaxID=1296 RepID=UPI001FB1B920|nr:helix-turn-helix transcriptional regulator [Mammaliicoccus sciuri]MCJ0920961.1 helix-turn-helix domain-containing protein [Mammaliicoccus sciuri]MCJ0958717.1 helix-turn-helix domain-containing protein [Mammaliicoccus sciuri]MCJ0963803.1 helix-turn-helix domain-containing protein [Mammaliicoccus sciuri]MCJ1777405.1 helix-turn-helix domain-containing protein [Mammaliicoccus sciuri]